MEKQTIRVVNNHKTIEDMKMKVESLEVVEAVDVVAAVEEEDIGDEVVAEEAVDAVVAEEAVNVVVAVEEEILEEEAVEEAHTEVDKDVMTIKEHTKMMGTFTEVTKVWSQSK